MTGAEAALAELAALGGAGWSAPFAAAIAPCAWAARAASDPPLPSGISHRRAFSFSKVMGAGAPELRFLIEPQALPATAATYWRAGLAVLARARAQGAALERFERVAPLFVPEEAAPFRMWIGGVLVADGGVRYKVYLCPAARGRAAAPDSLHEALRRLRLPGAVAALGPLGARDDITILSLDLFGEPPRVKLYLLQRDAELSALPGVPADDAARLGEALLGAAAARPRWWLTAHSFHDDDERPDGSAVHLGLLRDGFDDAELETRIVSLARALDVDPAPYQRGRAALPEGARAHHFVSFQRVAGRPRLTVYFSPRTASGSAVKPRM